MQALLAPQSSQWSPFVHCCCCWRSWTPSLWGWTPGTCQVKKMMWEYLCSQDLIFFVTKLGFKKWQKTSSAEVLTPPHLGLLAVGPSSPAGLARQPNLACKTDLVVLDQNGQWCWIKMGLWSQQHHQWIFGCNRQNHLKQNKWA